MRLLSRKSHVGWLPSPAHQGTRLLLRLCLLLLTLRLYQGFSRIKIWVYRL